MGLPKTQTTYTDTTENKQEGNADGIDCEEIRGCSAVKV